MIGRLKREDQSHSNSAITTLSGGNQQKVVIGRCLMPGPSVILLDEPSRGVDIGARSEVFRTMQTLAAEGIAVIFATSDLHEALSASDRILVMADGRITADLFRRKPTNARWSARRTSRKPSGWGTMNTSARPDLPNAYSSRAC